MRMADPSLTAKHRNQNGQQHAQFTTRVVKDLHQEDSSDRAQKTKRVVAQVSTQHISHEEKTPAMRTVDSHTFHIQKSRR